MPLDGLDHPRLAEELDSEALDREIREERESENARLLG